MEFASLTGYTIGITADRRWEDQAELLRRRGATILHGPSIRTHPLSSEAGLRAATDRLIAGPPDYLIANTGIGIRAWFDAVESWGLGEAFLAALRFSQIFARGPKAAGAIDAIGLEVAERAFDGRLATVVTRLLQSGLAGKIVAFQRHGSASVAIVAALVDAGATVIDVPVYRWTLPDDSAPALRLVQAAIGGRLRAVTFTSAPAVHNLFEIAAGAGLREELRSSFRDAVAAVAVGEVCAEALIACGVERPLVSSRARLGPMIRTVAEHLVDHVRIVRVGGRTMAVRGTVAVIDGERVDLSDREAAVLNALTRRVGVVVSKSALLGTVWGPSTDPHVLEVTVARLRRRLGPTGASVVSVPRRGYVLRARPLEGLLAHTAQTACEKTDAVPSP